MHRRYPLLALLSLFVVAITAWNCTMVLGYSGLPFALDPINPQSASVASLHGLALPGGLHEDDRVEYARQDTAARLSLLAVIEYATTTPGHSFPLVVTHHDGRHTTVSIPARRLATIPAFHVSVYFGFAWFILACLISLITLWRGRGRAALGIAVWAIAFECGMAFYLSPAGGWTILGFALASQLCYLAARIGFFLMADALTADALTPQARRLFRLAFAASLALGYAYELGYSLWFVFGGVLIPLVTALVWVLPYAIATAMILAAHHGAASAARPRLRWAFWSGVVLTFGILLSNFALFGYAHSYPIQILSYIIAFAGLLYSVLRHRVVDMSFVVNRAIVYSVTLTIVVAIFMLLESFAEKFALGEKASFALELGVPLVIGFTLEAVRKRLERFGERLFFRRKFENEQALRAFARQCAYIENPDRLLEESLRVIQRHTETPATAFYWHEQMQTYRRLTQAGESIYPERLGIDDRAVVAMRAERRATDLHELDSVLGESGLAFPMLGRGELLGAIVVAGRPGEAFPVDERELLAHLVHEVGAAMLALRARANALLLSAIADGTLSDAQVRERARVLMPPD